MTENNCECGSKAVYSEEYDTYFCEQCNKWLEDVCTDRSCLFCQNRPNTPKLVNSSES